MRHQPQMCMWCGSAAVRLCDWHPPIDVTRPRTAPVVTCSAPLCLAHAHQAAVLFLDSRTGPTGGRRSGHAESIDYCPDHAPRKAGDS